MDAVDGAHAPLGREVLQLVLDVVDGVAVEHVAQLGVAEQRLELRVIDRQRLGPPLGQRRVAVVEILGDVAEQQRRGERRRRRRVDGDHAQAALADRAQRLDQRRHVEQVAQALAVGLEQHRERAELRGDGEQIGGALALLPERRAAADAAPRQEQGPRRGLAELGREQRRRAELAQHQRLDVVGIGQHQPRIGRLVGVGEADDEAVVVPHRLGVDAALLAHAGEDRHRPRRHHPSAERRQQADAPVAQLVAAALDDEGAIVRHVADRRALIGQVLQQVLGRLPIEVVLLFEPGEGGGGRLRLERADQRADGAAELERPAGRLALPERHLARLARRRRDDDLVVGDVLDAPRRGAEQEGLADLALEDHLLVELADAGGRRPARRRGRRRRARDRGWCRRWRWRRAWRLRGRRPCGARDPR